jgi:hypothetical protein
MEEMKKLAKAGGYQHSTHPKGISLRDYFAGKALQSMLTTPQQFGEGTPEIAARWSYKFADAMLKERDKNQSESSVSVRQCDLFSVPKPVGAIIPPTELP